MRRSLRAMVDSGYLNAAAKPAPAFAKKPPTGPDGSDEPEEKQPLKPGAAAGQNFQPPDFHFHLHPPGEEEPEDGQIDPNDEEEDPSLEEEDPSEVDPKATEGSPMAQQVAQTHVDPLGATKKTFANLTKTSLAYKQAQEEAKRSVIPAMSVLKHVSDAHQLQPAMPGMGMDPNNPDASMGYDPQTGQPTNMMQQPGAQQMGNPQNARFGVGNGPQVPGGQPGAAATGAQTQVRPPKAGVPKPGQAKPASKAGNPGQDLKKGKGKSVKVEVQSAGDYGLKTKGRRQIESAAALANLRF
jgi:hypothetical protein